MINRITIRMDTVDMFISNNRPSRDVPPRTLSVGTSRDVLKLDARTHDAARTPVPCVDEAFSCAGSVTRGMLISVILRHATERGLMATQIEIKWYVAEDGSGHVTKFVHHGRGVTEKTYIFDSLSRRDQLPPRLASIIRQDGRSQATVSYETE